MKSSRIDLIVIDPQNDFCDIPDSLRQGFQPALPVQGAHEDMLRLAGFIRRQGKRLTDIHVTLDSHNPVDIAHPVWWVNRDGEHPAPYTVISAADVRSGIWQAANPLSRAYSMSYVEQLDSGQRYPLVIWPEHCLIGTWGHNVHQAVSDALMFWARERMEVVDFVTKGSNPLTEHYSAVQAEVPDPSDTSTLLNTRLIRTLSEADLVVVAGEALSHCVANTVRDIAANFGEENIRKLVLLRDCCSPVGGFEKLAGDFIDEMSARGMSVADSTTFMA